MDTWAKNKSTTKTKERTRNIQASTQEKKKLIGRENWYKTEQNKNKR